MKGQEGEKCNLIFKKTGHRKKLTSELFSLIIKVDMAVKLGGAKKFLPHNCCL